MSDKHITEILPDLDKMPAWAREAFEAGQFFDAAFKRVVELEAKLDAVSDILCHDAITAELKRRGTNPERHMLNLGSMYLLSDVVRAVRKQYSEIWETDK